MTTENTVNYAIKIIAPLISGKASEVEVKADAEREYIARVQAVSKTRIISTCSNVRLLGVILSIFMSLKILFWI